jgi:hypothetical protein
MAHQYYPDVKELSISHSSRNMMHGCGRRFEFAKLYEKSGDDTGLAAEVGTALHRGYQHYLVTGDVEYAVFAMMQEYPYALNDNPMHDRSIEASYATLMAMIEADCMAGQELAQIQCLDNVVRPAIEVPFEFTIKGFSLSRHEHIPVTYVGQIDAIMIDHISGEPIVTDIKTHRRNLVDMSPVYQFSDQCLPYAIVLETLLGRPISNGLQTQYLSTYVDIRNPSMKSIKFNKTSQDVEDWARGLMLDLQWLQYNFDLGWFPRNGEACTGYGSVCHYMDYCAMRDHEALKMFLEMGNLKKRKRRNPEPWVKIELELAA